MDTQPSARPSFHCLLYCPSVFSHVSCDVVLGSCGFLWGFVFSSCEGQRRTELLNKGRPFAAMQKLQECIDTNSLCVTAFPLTLDCLFFLNCFSHRSRDEDRISKPGGMSTPVKSFDDGVLSQASDQASSRDDKQLPPLPGKGTTSCLVIICCNLYLC